MRWLAFVTLLASCATEQGELPGATRDAAIDDAPTEASESGVPAGAARIAAFNVHRLFDTTCDSGTCGSAEYEPIVTPAQLEKRLDLLATRLLSLHADAILVAEIETAALLDALAARMPGYVTHVLGETGAAASVDVGVLSLHKTIAVRRHRDRVLTRPDGSPTTFARELLEVELDVRGRRAIVFAAHFRSKSNDDPGRRYAEAEGARAIVAASASANPDALVVLGGDLNDVPGSPPLTVLEEGSALTRVSQGLPLESIATFWYAGEGVAIDHLYVTNAKRYLAPSFRVVRDPGSRTFAGSDHAAVVADFSGF